MRNGLHLGGMAAAWTVRKLSPAGGVADAELALGVRLRGREPEVICPAGPRPR